MLHFVGLYYTIILQCTAQKNIKKKYRPSTAVTKDTATSAHLETDLFLEPKVASHFRLGVGKQVCRNPQNSSLLTHTDKILPRIRSPV